MAERKILLLCFRPKRPMRAVAPPRRHYEVRVLRSEGLKTMDDCPSVLTSGIDVG
jgi:hypothetical protein